MNLTKKGAVRLHRLLWNKIAKLLEEGITFPEAGSAKEHAMNILRQEGFVDPEEIIQANCFCCHYVLTNFEKVYSCRPVCPIIWKKKGCRLYGGEYGQFNNFILEENFELASELAKKIADLPERPDQDFDVL